MDDLKKAIRKIAKPGGWNVTLDRAIVLSVDKNELTCNVITVADDLELDDVKLKPVVIDGDISKMGLILYPAIGSFVTIGQIDDDNSDVCVMAMTEIESISLDTATALKLLITGDGKLNLNAVQTVFNDGKNGGIPLLKPLTDIINKLQKKVNDLSDAFDKHTHIGVTTGSGISGIPKTFAPARISPLIKPEDIENKIIAQ